MHFATLAADSEPASGRDSKDPGTFLVLAALYRVRMSHIIFGFIMRKTAAVV